MIRPIFTKFRTSLLFVFAFYICSIYYNEKPRTSLSESRNKFPGCLLFLINFTRSLSVLAWSKLGCLKKIPPRTSFVLRNCQSRTGYSVLIGFYVYLFFSAFRPHRRHDIVRSIISPDVVTSSVSVPVCVFWAHPWVMTLNVKTRDAGIAASNGVGFSNALH